MRNKKIILILLAVILVVIASLLFIKLNSKEKENKSEAKDSIKFKEEYEKLNNSTSPKVSLEDDNPFVYTDIKKIVSTLKNGTGIIYLGFPKCPWCRNAVNVLQYINTDKILYLDMTDIRDTYEVKDGALVKTKDAVKEYYEMLDILKDILSDYEVVDNGVKYQTGEKRIYVPLVIGVLNGKIVGYHADTVDLEENQKPSDLLTEKQKSSLKLIYDEINSKVNSSSCDIDSDHGC